MMYQVKYLKPKKKGTAMQTATFYKIEDAVFWEGIVKDQGATNIQILTK